MTAVFISARRAMSLAPQPLWLDCRYRLDDPAEGRRLFAAGHISGAFFADLDKDLADLSRGRGRHPLPEPDDFAGRCEQWGVDSGPVVVYDDMSGAMAARAWWLLRWMGHEDVYVLDGGLDGWLRAGGTLTADRPAAGQTGDPADRFSAAPGAMPVVNAEQIRQWIETPAVDGRSGRLMLLDARAGERFRGEVEPIDRAAGHVPGAMNRPFSDSLEDGRLLEQAALMQSWRDTLGGVAPGQVTHMCGSGVTACFNLACMEHLGLSGSSLYVGSWSDWIADPGNPLARG